MFDATILKLRTTPVRRKMANDYVLIACHVLVIVHKSYGVLVALSLQLPASGSD